MLLADSASFHPDGTISMLRAWINRVSGTGPPFPFKSVLVARIQASPEEAGTHTFALACVDDSNAQIHEMGGEFEIDGSAPVVGFLVNVRVDFPTAGAYAFVLRVDGAEAERWPMLVVSE